MRKSFLLSFCWWCLVAPLCAQQCPAPATITSGTKQNEVPYLILAASGIGTGHQKALLVREFNTKASELAQRYCSQVAGCVAVYKPADSSNIKFERRDFGGWTELTIASLSGTPGSGNPPPQPVVLGPHRRERAGLIVPPSPNVECKEAPPLPPPPKRPPPPPPPTLPPVTECKQPRWHKPAGTIVIKKQIPYAPSIAGDGEDKLIKYVTDPVTATGESQAQLDIQAVLDQWRKEAEKECKDLNPGKNCEAELTPAPQDVFEIESGDSGLGTQPFLNYIIKLKNELRAECVPR